MVHMGTSRTSKEESEPLLHNSGVQEEMSEMAKVIDDHSQGNQQTQRHGIGQSHTGANTRNGNNNSAPPSPASSLQNAARSLKAQKMRETWDLVMKWIRLFALTVTFIVIDTTLYVFTLESATTIPIGATVGVEACLGVLGGFVALGFAIPSIDHNAPLDVNHFLCKIPSFCAFYCGILHIICMGAAMEALSRVWPPVFVLVLGCGLMALTAQVWWYSGDGRDLVIDTQSYV